MEKTHTLLANVKCEYPEEHLGLPRVTGILDVREKKELWEWRMRVGPGEAEKVTNEAKRKGTAVHGAIERFLQDLPYSLLADYQPYFDGFLRWYEKYQPTEIYAEQPLCDHTLGFIGRCDLIAKIDGKWWVIDFKTSKKLSPAMGLQLSAYAWAIEQLLGIVVEGRMIVRLTDKTQRGYQVKEYEDELPIFLSHLDIWYWLDEEKPVDPNANWNGGLIFAPGAAAA